MTLKPLQEIPYTASTGREFVLRQLEDVSATGIWPRLYWTYTYEHEGIPYGPSIGRLTNRHRTQEAVIERIEAQERIRLAEESVPRGGLDRATYETLCVRHRAGAYSDSQIRERAYGLRYGEFTLPEYSAGAIIARVLAAGRLVALEAQEAQRNPTAAPAPSATRTRTQRKCLICGAYADMNASLGPACADHYDELS
jgi:hypothetical protein